MLLTSSILIDSLIILLIGIYFLCTYFSKKHAYWKKRGVYTPPIDPIFGHFFEIATLRKSMAVWIKYYYDNTDKPYFGLYVFDDPYIIVKDPQLVKNVLIRDFNCFVDRNIAAPKHISIYKNMMFLQKSPAWKNDRYKLSAVFTSSKLKNMFELLKQSEDNLAMYLQNNRRVFEAKKLATKISTNVISLCVFGIDSHCFSTKPSDFEEFARKCFDFNFRNAFAQMVYFFKPNWVDRLHLEFMPKESMDYFTDAFWSAMNLRKDSERTNDLVDVINDLRKSKELGQNDKDLVCAMAIQFFLAGYETTSSTISFTLYELAKNSFIQDKLRKEIKSVIAKHNKLSYEAVNNMPYLEMCLNETLRMYPVLPFLDRKCNSDYLIPDTKVIIEKGTPVLIPTYGLHMDENYFPDPQTFNPERFNQKKNSSNGIYFFPFGEGPRGCIGKRFGSLSTKLSIITILLNSEVVKCKETPDPIVFEPKSLLMQSTVGLPLMFKSLDS